MVYGIFGNDISHHHITHPLSERIVTSLPTVSENKNCCRHNKHSTYYYTPFQAKCRTTDVFVINSY